MASLPPVVWSDDVLRHEPRTEVWVGVATPGTEVPDRARVLLEAPEIVCDLGAPDTPSDPRVGRPGCRKRS